MLATRPVPPESASPVTFPPRSTETSLREIRERIQVLVEAAVSNGSTISVDELRTLMPVSRFPTDGVLLHFLVTDERLSVRLAEIRGEITLRGREDLAGSRPSQRVLARNRSVQADVFLQALVRICPWINLAGISGSTAYGGAKPGDDIDFFLITARHRLWISLFFAMAMARLGRLRSKNSPVYCFNRIAEQADCEKAFRESREPLFAREALNLAILHGRALYGHLLASAPWMEIIFPELYATRLREARRASDEVRGRGRAASGILNGAAFLTLAPYLWLAGLVRNVRLERAKRDKECFRTVIRPDRYATESTVYDELREAYREAFVC